VLGTVVDAGHCGQQDQQVNVLASDPGLTLFTGST